MLVLPIEINQTASAGSWSFNTQSIPAALLNFVICESASGATTYDFTIVDDKDNVIYAPTTATGTLRAEIYIPVRGVLTIKVDSASADEAFTGRLMFDET